MKKLGVEKMEALVATFLGVSRTHVRDMTLAAALSPPPPSAKKINIVKRLLQAFY